MFTITIRQKDFEFDILYINLFEGSLWLFGQNCNETNDTVIFLYWYVNENKSINQENIYDNNL